MKFPQTFSKNIYQGLIFVAAFLLVATSLMAFPGEHGDEEKKEASQQQAAQQKHMLEATEEDGGDVTSSPEETEATLQRADVQLAEWEKNEGSIPSGALEQLIVSLEKEAMRYRAMSDEASSIGDVETGERNSNDLARIEALLTRGGALTAMSQLPSASHRLVPSPQVGLRHRAVAVPPPAEEGELRPSLLVRAWEHFLGDGRAGQVGVGPFQVGSVTVPRITLGRVVYYGERAFVGGFAAYVTARVIAVFFTNSSPHE